MAEGRGGGVEGGEVGRGRSRKMAELPSGCLSHSPGLRDPPGSPGPGWKGAAALGRRPRGWCMAEWGAAGKDNTPARILGGGRGRSEDQAGIRHRATGPRGPEGSPSWIPAPDKGRAGGGAVM